MQETKFEWPAAAVSELHPHMPQLSFDQCVTMLGTEASAVEVALHTLPVVGCPVAMSALLHID